jgi:hypothetical protein
MPNNHAQYSAVRSRAYQFMSAQLGYTGQQVSLSEISAAVWPLFNQQWVLHPARQYRKWAWPSLVHEDRNDDPACFEVAILCQQQLCGLACGRGEIHSFCSIEFIEASPEPHALKGMITDISIQTLIVYAKLLGRQEVRVARPSARLASQILNGGLGFTVVSHPGQAQYLSLRV